MNKTIVVGYPYRCVFNRRGLVRMQATANGDMRVLRFSRGIYFFHFPSFTPFIHMVCYLMSMAYIRYLLQNGDVSLVQLKHLCYHVHINLYRFLGEMNARGDSRTIEQPSNKIFQPGHGLQCLAKLVSETFLPSLASFLPRFSSCLADSLVSQ